MPRVLRASWRTLACLVALCALVPAVAADPPGGTRAAGATDSQQINRLIGQLGADRFVDREEAGKRLVAIGPPALDQLRRAAVGSDKEVARRAANCIREIEADATARDLASQLRSKDAGERAAAARRLMRMGRAAKAAVPALTEALGDHDRCVRLYVAMALLCIGKDAKPAAPRLIALLTDPHADEEIKARVARGLAGLDPPVKEAVPVLLYLLELAPTGVRQMAAYGLTDLAPDDPRVVRALLRAVDGGPAPVQAAAGMALGNVGKRAGLAVPALARALRRNRGQRSPEAYYARNSLLLALERFGRDAKSAVPAILEVAQDEREQAHLRCDAIRILGAMGPAAAEAVPALTRLQQSQGKGADLIAAEVAIARQRIDGAGSPDK